jgi:hypothetical protein
MCQTVLERRHLIGSLVVALVHGMVRRECLIASADDDLWFRMFLLRPDQRLPERTATRPGIGRLKCRGFGSRHFTG